MSETIHRYAFEDEQGGEQGWATFNYSEAREYAKRYHLLIIDHSYEWEDSEPADDFRESAVENHTGPYSPWPKAQDVGRFKVGVSG